MLAASVKSMTEIKAPYKVEDITPYNFAVYKYVHNPLTKSTVRTHMANYAFDRTQLRYVRTFLKGQKADGNQH